MTTEQALRDALQAFEKRGTGFDSCPTRRLPRSDEAKQVDQWWLRYFMDADLSVRSFARQALALPTAAPVDERATFENWMESPPPGICSEGSPMAGEYRDRNWQEMWEAFQAGAAWQARASLQSVADATNKEIPLLSDDEMPPLPEPIAYKMNWPADAGVGLKRFCWAYEWPSNEKAVHLFGGSAIALHSADQLRARDRAVVAAVRKQMGVV